MPSPRFPWAVAAALITPIAVSHPFATTAAAASLADFYKGKSVDSHGESAFSGIGNKRAEEDRVAQLERKIGQQVLEIDFLKRALQHVEQQRQLRALTGGAISTNRSKKKQ